MAEWLFETFPGEPGGALSKRLNALVTGAVCADVARGLGVSDQLKLGKQARDDGAADSDNVLGDVMEALIGALYLDAGLEPARKAIRKAWGDRVKTRGSAAPQHPKSALQEWARRTTGARPLMTWSTGRPASCAALHREGLDRRAGRGDRHRQLQAGSGDGGGGGAAGEAAGLKALFWCNLNLLLTDAPLSPWQGGGKKMASRATQGRTMLAASLDRRAEPRHPVHVTRATARSHRKQATAATLSDISTYGCRILSPVEHPPGERIWLRLDGGLPLAATVIWCSEGRVGCRFDETSPARDDAPVHSRLTPPARPRLCKRAGLVENHAGPQAPDHKRALRRPGKGGEPPDPLVIVPVPALVAMLLHHEQEKGWPRQRLGCWRPDGAVCMTVPRSVAVGMAETRGHDDLDAERIWEEWTAARQDLPSL